MRISYCLIIVLILAFFRETKGQVLKKDSTLIQFSGVFVDAENLTPVPWVNIIVVNSQKGTSTDYKGAFSFVAHRGDTVLFSCIGYKPFQCVIPDSLSTKRYTLLQLFSRDTINLPEVVIFPWPSKDEFRSAFLELYIPDDDLERARKNLELAAKKDEIEGYPTWGSLNYKYSNQAYIERMYYIGQAPPNPLLNPFAWLDFLKLLKEGKLKNQKKQKSK